jgi:hypothetical protein
MFHFADGTSTGWNLFFEGIGYEEMKEMTIDLNNCPTSVTLTTWDTNALCINSVSLEAGNLGKFWLVNHGQGHECNGHWLGNGDDYNEINYPSTNSQGSMNCPAENVASGCSEDFQMFENYCVSNENMNSLCYYDAVAT